VEPDKFETYLILALDAYRKSSGTQTSDVRPLNAQMSHTQFTHEDTYVSAAMREEQATNMFVRVMDHYYECFTNKNAQMSHTQFTHKDTYVSAAMRGRASN
jgi:hypothetical protein